MLISNKQTVKILHDITILITNMHTLAKVCMKMTKNGTTMEVIAKLLTLARQAQGDRCLC